MVCGCAALARRPSAERADELLESHRACRARAASSSANCPAARSSASPSPARSLSSRKVLLLDEPLSALDLKLRQHMRNELRAIQKRVGITFIYITHDQGEALTMSDRIAVMNDGRDRAGRRRQHHLRSARHRLRRLLRRREQPLHRRVVQADDASAVVDTAFRPAARPQSAGSSSRATRPSCSCGPKSLRLGTGAEDTTIEPSVKNVAFEGNASHLFLEGAGEQGHHADRRPPAIPHIVPEQGAKARHIL